MALEDQMKQSQKRIEWMLQRSSKIISHPAIIFFPIPISPASQNPPPNLPQLGILQWLNFQDFLFAILQVPTSRAHPAHIPLTLWLFHPGSLISSSVTNPAERIFCYKQTKLLVTLLRMISGATYSGVPQNVHVFLPDPIFFAKPKST